MGIAPAAAWIAVRGSLDPRILLLTPPSSFGAQASTSSMAARITSSTAPRSLFRPKAFGIRNALDIARLFHLITLPLLVWMVLAFGLGQDCARRSVCGRTAADLRAFAGEARRPQPGECRLLHHERPGLDGIPVFHRSRPAAVAVSRAVAAGAMVVCPVRSALAKALKLRCDERI